VNLEPVKKSLKALDADLDDLDKKLTYLEKETTEIKKGWEIILSKDEPSFQRKLFCFRTDTPP